jgi:hypothetical protein
MRRLLVLLLLLLVVPLAGAPPKKPAAPVPLAPPTFPHHIAMFLTAMSHDGARAVTFKATAIGTRFFFEEGSGVTVYVFRNGEYVKETFLANTTLAKATKRYGVS